MANGVIRYWAAARAAAGVAEEPYAAATLAEALQNACRARDSEFGRVLVRSSFLLDGRQVGNRPHDSVQLTENGVLEVLPPFAGG
ncbi:MoaD/ThiS family protein [Actinocorallia longicatena]|uniref:MoaD/ThiS family protein n=1 Tax=Actinocorallia longicatena TaxID=111803 RepID=A0ABP6QLX9_9ACTN